MVLFPEVGHSDNFPNAVIVLEEGRPSLKAVGEDGFSLNVHLNFDQDIFFS